MGHWPNHYATGTGKCTRVLAKQLVDNTFADTVFFTNSGAEAVETAIKCARSYHQNAEKGDSNRFEMITFANAFHGRTMATISASNQTKMHHGFSPLLDGFKYAKFDDLESKIDRMEADADLVNAGKADIDEAFRKIETDDELEKELEDLLNNNKK